MQPSPRPTPNLPLARSWSYFDWPHSASSAFVALALEAMRSDSQIAKYNPFSSFVNYSFASSVWREIVAHQPQPVCPTSLAFPPSFYSTTTLRDHMDQLLAHALRRRDSMRNMNNDALFFAFPTYVVPTSDWFHDVADVYDNSLIIFWLLTRADDETSNLPRAVCYLTMAKAIADTFLRLMRAGGYTPDLPTPEARLGSFNGLFARYPAAWDAPGDLGNNARASSHPIQPYL